MVKYNGKEYDIPNANFLNIILQENEDGEPVEVVNILPEDEVAQLIVDAYHHTMQTVKMTEAQKIYFEKSFEENIKKFKYPRVKPVGSPEIKKIELGLLVEKKKKEIKEAKKAYQNDFLSFKINGKKYHFFGGLDSAQKYQNALDAASLVGNENVIIKVKEGMLTLKQAQLKPVISAIKFRVHNGWLKEQEYLEKLKKVRSVKSVNAIKWKV